MSSAARVLALFLILSGLVVVPAAAEAPAPTLREGKPGGTLRMVLREDLPQGFAIHDTATNSVTWPSMPCYSNLFVYDQTKRSGAWRPSSPSWRRSGRGRTTTGTSSSFSGKTSSGTTRSPSPRRT